MLLAFIASENFALMLAVGSTPDVPLGGTVLTTVGAPGAVQATLAKAPINTTIPTAAISTASLLLNTSCVLLPHGRDWSAPPTSADSATLALGDESPLNSWLTSQNPQKAKLAEYLLHALR